MSLNLDSETTLKQTLQQLWNTLNRHPSDFIFLNDKSQRFFNNPFTKIKSLTIDFISSLWNIDKRISRKIIFCPAKLWIGLLKLFISLNNKIKIVLELWFRKIILEDVKKKLKSSIFLILFQKRELWNRIIIFEILIEFFSLKKTLWTQN